MTARFAFSAKICGGCVNPKIEPPNCCSANATKAFTSEAIKPKRSDYHGARFHIRRKGQMAGRRAILRKPAVTRSRRENSSTSTASKSDASNAGRIVRDLTNHPGVEEAEPIPLRYSELTCQALEISTCKQGGTLQTILLSTHVANTALCIRHHLLSRIDDSLSIPKFK